MAFSKLSTGTRGLLQLAAAWGIGALVIVMGIAHFDEIRAGLGMRLEAEDFGVRASVQPDGKKNVGSDRTVAIAANHAGHFETRAKINGRTVNVMVDTGATMVALTFEDAATAGIHPSVNDFRQSVSTANGHARVAPVYLDQISIDDIIVRDVRAVVAEPGRLGVSLLGMSFLGQLAKFEFSRGQLLMQE